jgi:hypothetical protein
VAGAIPRSAVPARPRLRNVVPVSAQDRLDRIAEAHTKYVDPSGGTSGDCAECGWGCPCPTYIWATTNRDPLATWDPSDDEDQG